MDVQKRHRGRATKHLLSPSRTDVSADSGPEHRACESSASPELADMSDGPYPPQTWSLRFLCVDDKLEDTENNLDWKCVYGSDFIDLGVPDSKGLGAWAGSLFLESESAIVSENGTRRCHGRRAVTILSIS